MLLETSIWKRGRPAASAACVAAALLVATLQAASADVLEIGVKGVRRLGVATNEQAPLPKDSPKAGSPDRTVAKAIVDAAAAYDLSPALVSSVAQVESNFVVDARSPVGAIGVMQLMPDTAADLGVDPNDPVANVFGGAAYLRQQLDRFDGRLDLALAAYNAGPHAVARHKGVPPFAETQTYVGKALDVLAAASDGPESRQ